MVTTVAISRQRCCAQFRVKPEVVSKCHRQERHPHGCGSSCWTLLAASTFIAPLKRRRAGGRPLQGAGGGQVAGSVGIDQAVLSNALDDNQSIEEMRYGVIDASMLCWTHEKLQQLLPEVKITGMVLPQEAASCGPDQFAAFLNVLEAEEVDFVVAPVKDVALSLPEGLVAAAILREDARDALVVRPQASPVKSLSELPAGSRVCVTCPRRRIQIAARFPSLSVEECDLPSQSVLRRLYSLDYDAVVAAVAGLQRTGLHISAEEVSPLNIDELVPALGQGAIAMLCRAKDEELVSLLGACDDSTARVCVVAERNLLKRLGRLPDGTAVGGLAELRSDDILSLHCALAIPGVDSSLPRISQAQQEGRAENAEALVQTLVDELQRDESNLASSKTAAAGPEGAKRRMSRTLTDDEDLEDMEAEESRDASNALEALPAIGAQERLSTSRIDGTGGTAYPGRVCAVLANRRGVLVDINCEVPAFWHPELVASESSSSSSSLPADFSANRGSNSQGLPALGSSMEVYCCAKHSWHLRALCDPPPRLPVRLGVDPLRLKELRPGLGPWRAVVLSSTDDGTLVDFNCEIPGYLQSDQRHFRGEELRVYCYKVDAAMRLCVVGTTKESSRLGSSRRKLEDLVTVDGSAGIRGSVLRVAESGVFVDFNCQVKGYLSPMDIDMMSSSSLCKGCEVTVYIKSINLAKRQVQLSMFPMRKPVRVIGAAG